LDEKNSIISKLRNDADTNAQKILFLSHYATQMRVEESRKSNKRRLSDLSDKEKKLYRRVSEVCHSAITTKLDKQEQLSKELQAQFDESTRRLELASLEVSDRYKQEILELKSRLLGNSNNSIS